MQWLVLFEKYMDCISEMVGTIPEIVGQGRCGLATGPKQHKGVYDLPRGISEVVPRGVKKYSDSPRDYSYRVWK
jgi:hypothetical protein